MLISNRVEAYKYSKRASVHDGVNRGWGGVRSCATVLGRFTRPEQNDGNSSHADKGAKYQQPRQGFTPGFARRRLAHPTGTPLFAPSQPTGGLWWQSSQSVPWELVALRRCQQVAIARKENSNTISLSKEQIATRPRPNFPLSQFWYLIVTRGEAFSNWWGLQCTIVRPANKTVIWRSSNKMCDSIKNKMEIYVNLNLFAVHCSRYDSIV